jgi:hypothetical protein
MLLISAETIDNYKGFQYVIPKRLASHQSPYVKVLWQDKSVAYILLKSKQVVFYASAPNEVREQLTVIETWIEKNINLSKKVWNRLNEVKI